MDWLNHTAAIHLPPNTSIQRPVGTCVRAYDKKNAPSITPENCEVSYEGLYAVMATLLDLRPVVLWSFAIDTRGLIGVVDVVRTVL